MPGQQSLSRRRHVVRDCVRTRIAPKDNNSAKTERRWKHPQVLFVRADRAAFSFVGDVYHHCVATGFAVVWTRTRLVGD